VTVAIAYLQPGSIDIHFKVCLDRVKHYDRLHGQLIGAEIPVTTGSGGIAAGRNGAVAFFLEHCDRDEWLWFVDSDMGFAPDTIEALVATADPKERPIVGGLAFCQMAASPELDELGVPVGGHWYAPTIYMYNEEVGMPQSMSDYPRDSLIQCYATGAACLLIHRSVFEKMAESYPGPHSWFDRKIINGEEWSEDIVFCARANTCGFPLIVDTSIKTSHKKDHYLTEETVGDKCGKPIKLPAEYVPPLKYAQPELNREARRRKQGPRDASMGRR